MIINQNKFNNIIKIAKEKNPFYKKWIKGNYCPIIDRETFRKNNDLILNGIKPIASTSGSSGVPIKTFISYDLAKINHDIETEINRKNNFNYPPISISYINSNNPIEGNKININNSIRRQTVYIQKLIKEKKSKSIYSMPSMIYEVSKFCLEKKIKFPEIKRLVFMGEQFDDFYKEKINQVFPNATHIATYSAIETGPIGETIDTSCKIYKIHKDLLGIEIVDDNDNILPINNFGNIVITHYLNEEFPVIRYKIGDLGKIIELNNELYLTNIVGKTRGMIYKLDGKKYVFTDLSVLLRDIPNMIQYQVIQNEIEDLKINYKSEYNLEKEITDVVNYYFGRLPNKLSIEKVDKIERQKSGKYIACINRVDE